jgi:phage shock protein PspC (stress-responsive transcriptional regulator)
VASSRSIVAPDDRLLGACYAVAANFGFDPGCLRLLFAFAILWSPALGLIAYAALTAIVSLWRWRVSAPFPAGGAALDRRYQGMGAPR